ncbi:MAG: hypothetical protein ABI554_00915 [Flavobacterium sp.]
MSKKEKDKKKKDKKKKETLNAIKKVENCKSSCCDKYKKSESKRCKRCPMYDLIKKVA